MLILAQNVLLENIVTFKLIYYSIVRRKNIIGARVREARKRNKVTQLELAAQLQVLGITMDRSGVAKLETYRRPASDIEAAAIAKILKVSVASFFEESDSLLESLRND